MLKLLIAILALVPVMGNAKVIMVGPGQLYATPSAAAKKAKDGDVINIDARGDYLNDVVVWKQNNITIQGVNGRPHIKNENFISNEKGIWVIRGNNVTISNIELSGAAVFDKNGAAIRLQGKDFHLSDCYIHHNENGILVGNARPNSIVTIERCEFAYNGYGNGYSHNIYIGRIGKFILKDSYTHDANIGHTVKSRARENYILYNLIVEGKSSYAIDLSNGGYALVMGNILQQDSETDNSALLTFGPERYKHKENTLEVYFNTFVNQRHFCVFVAARKGGNVNIKNNLFAGAGKVVRGEANMKRNIHIKDLATFTRKEGVKIKPRYLSKLIDKAVPVKDLWGKKLIPERQFIGGRTIRREKQGQDYDLGGIEFNSAVTENVQ